MQMSQNGNGSNNLSRVFWKISIVCNKKEFYKSVCHQKDKQIFKRLAWNYFGKKPEQCSTDEEQTDLDGYDDKGTEPEWEPYTSFTRGIDEMEISLL